MELKVSLHDSDGNEIEIPNCICGQPSSTFIQGINAMMWRCNECFYGKQKESDFIYRPKFLSSMPVQFPTLKVKDK